MAKARIEGRPLTDPAYLYGFGNHFATEAVPGALPEGRNSPQNDKTPDLRH